MGVANSYTCYCQLYRLVPVLFTSVQQFHPTCPVLFTPVQLCTFFLENFYMFSFTPFLLSPGLTLHTQCCLFSAHMGMMVFVKHWSILYSNPSTRVKNSHLDATTEQNADLDPEWLELRTTLHVVRGYARRRTKPTERLPVPVVTKVTAWTCQWAAELLKKSLRLIKPCTRLR